MCITSGKKIFCLQDGTQLLGVLQKLVYLTPLTTVCPRDKGTPPIVIISVWNRWEFVGDEIFYKTGDWTGRPQWLTSSYWADVMVKVINQRLKKSAIARATKTSHSFLSAELSDKADNSWERGEFIAKVSLPGPTHTLPGRPLIQCEPPATRLNGWSWEVGGSVNLSHLFTLHLRKDPLVIV